MVHVGKSPPQIIDFVKIDIKSVRVVVVSDALFTNTPRLKCQLRYLILIIVDYRRANIVHYWSSRCHHETESAVVADVHVLIHVVDVVMLVQDALIELLGRTIEMKAFLDSRTLFNIVT